MGSFLSERALAQLQGAEQVPFHGPVPTQMISNGEFTPLPQTPRQRKVEDRLKDLADTTSRRLGMDDFWHSLKCIRCGACMNTCPVYRRSGGLAYGATYSGPIGVILDPTFDEFKYSELPFHSTLCGSCSAVCPVKIDISDQIYKWRRVMAGKGYLPLAKRLSFEVAGRVFGEPGEYRMAVQSAEELIESTPHFLLYNRYLNPWGRSRELPPIAKQTFREWYIENRRKAANA